MLLHGCAEPPEIRSYSAPRPENARPFTCVVPQTWRMVPNDRFSDLAFESEDNGYGPARVTVSSLGGQGEQFLLMNLNRWRGQVELEPMETVDNLQTVPLKKGQAKVVDLAGATRAIRGAMVEHDQQTWFFKLSGTTEAVKDQTDEFDAFLKSVEFFEAEGDR